MRSGRSPLLLLLLGVAFALWSPLHAMPDSYIRRCVVLPDYSKRCGVPQQRFFHNITSMSCEPFYFLECPGNLNNYDTIEECHVSCNFCQLPPEHGPCNYKTDRWFYDPKNKDCKKFTFGGCGGNFNNFSTRWNCRLRCRHRGPS
ncbi:BPTI/Kunitz domain-containing protein-like [Ahaetulla prasina]|uniref:BPTI/Kunitz domain-containing protein-like n=1 Tax=Ahaetulla prasina TaxID=499056 RepID=UPI002649EE80|nr:BPTI/Kunitz domain-containing protein-like [Ahaetulla prasina]